MNFLIDHNLGGQAEIFHIKTRSPLKIQLSRRHSMQITLNLDESLLGEALQLTKLTTQEDLINLALQELVQSRRKKNLFDLAGQIQFVPDFDHKILRDTRHAADWYICLDQRFPRWSTTDQRSTQRSNAPAA